MCMVKGWHADSTCVHAGRHGRYTHARTPAGRNAPADPELLGKTRTGVGCKLAGPDREQALVLAVAFLRCGDREVQVRTIITIDAAPEACISVAKSNTVGMVGGRAVVSAESRHLACVILAICMYVHPQLSSLHHSSSLHTFLLACKQTLTALQGVQRSPRTGGRDQGAGGRVRPDGAKLARGTATPASIQCRS